ncbi:MAG: NAD-binding protein [Gemmatimonadales bacterium]
MSGVISGLGQRPFSRRKRIFLAIWFLATLGAGALGYLEYEARAGTPVSLATAFYHAAQLFILHAPHFTDHVPSLLEGARWSAAGLLGFSVLQVAQQLFPSEWAAIRCLLARNHVIIGGLGRRALQCVKCERGKPPGLRRKVVVVDRNPPEDMAKRCASEGAIVITGDINDPAVLRGAGLRRAAELWALCAEDSVNCETAVHAGAVLSEFSRKQGMPPLECNVHLSDIDLRVEMQRYADLAVPGVPLLVRFFDVYDFEARRVLLHDLPIDHDGIGSHESRRPHLIILGFGRMGRSIALRAAKLGHFANGVADPGRRLRISVIDRIGQTHEAGLLFRYPQFRSTCELDVHTMDIESPAARRLVEDWCAEPDALISLAVCFDDALRATEVALRLVPDLRSETLRAAVRVADRDGLGKIVDRVWGTSSTAELPGPTSAAFRVRTFGLLHEGCCEAALDDGTEELARAIHADYITQQLARGANPAERSLAPWDALDEDLRESNRQQADHIVIKLRAIRCQEVSHRDPRPAVEQFAPGEVELLAQLEHLRWNAERVLAGWRWAPGPKNVVLRTTPYLREWDEVPDEVRQNDRGAVRLIPRLLAAVGQKVVRI